VRKIVEVEEYAIIMAMELNAYAVILMIGLWSVLIEELAVNRNLSTTMTIMMAA
jgi:hypothetical protein